MFTAKTDKLEARQQAAATQGASKLAHSKGVHLECGSLLPPSYGEACFALAQPPIAARTQSDSSNASTAKAVAPSDMNIRRQGSPFSPPCSRSKLSECARHAGCVD